MVIDTEIVPALVRHLNHPILSVLIPCLRTLGNIVTGNEKQTSVKQISLSSSQFFVIFYQLVVNYPGFASTILELLNHEKKPVRREACWVLSNITAGTPANIDVLLRCDGLVKKLCMLSLTDSPEVIS